MKPISHEKDENDSYGIMTCSIMVFSVLTFGLILFLLICRIIHCLFSKCDTVFFSDDNLLFIIFDVIVKATGFRHIAMYLASDYGFVSNIAFIFMAFSLLALVTIYFFFKKNYLSHLPNKKPIPNLEISLLLLFSMLFLFLILVTISSGVSFPVNSLK